MRKSLLTLTLLFAIATPVACAPPSWGPGSAGYSCFKYEIWHNISIPGVPGDIASITAGSTICTQDGTYLYSSTPYAYMNKKGLGRTPIIDEGIDGATTQYLTSYSTEFEAAWYMRNCPAGDYWLLNYLCSPVTHVHVLVGYTTPPNIGPQGQVRAWTDGNNFVSIH